MAPFASPLTLETLETLETPETLETLETINKKPASCVHDRLLAARKALPRFTFTRLA